MPGTVGRFDRYVEYTNIPTSIHKQIDGYRPGQLARVTIQSVSAGEQMNLMQRLLKAYGAVTGATGVSITTMPVPRSNGDGQASQ